MIFLYRLSVAFSLITVIADLGKYATFHWLISWLPYSRTLLKNSGLYRIVRYQRIAEYLPSLVQSSFSHKW